MGGLRNERPTHGQTDRRRTCRALSRLCRPVWILARADSGFYCWEAVAAYQQAHCQFVIVARKTRRLVEQLQQAEKPNRSKRRIDPAECEFLYASRKVGPAALANSVMKRSSRRGSNISCLKPALKQPSATSESRRWRGFTPNGGGNLIKDANNEAGLAAHPSRRFDMNRNHGRWS